MKNKQKKTLFILLSFAFINAFTQENSAKNFFFKIPKGNSVIASKKAITHIAPSVGAAIDDSLTFGTPISILMLVPYSESINGIEVPWVKCTYKKGEFTKVTFILANDVALTSARSNGTLSVIGFNKSEADSIFFKTTISATNINFEKIISFSKTPQIDSLRFELIDPTGLKNVTNIFATHYFVDSLKHSFHYLTCSKSNQVIALEKADNSINAKVFSGKIWAFPSSEKSKKNTLTLYDYTDKLNNKNHVKITKIKLKNCTLQ